jgi:hypothetical protein
MNDITIIRTNPITSIVGINLGYISILKISLIQVAIGNEANIAKNSASTKDVLEYIDKA